MNNIEKAFRNSHLFSKEDLIQSFKLMIEHIQSDEESEYTEKSKQKKLELCNKFMSSLEKCKLPTLTELWWFYHYEFTYKGIDLNLCTADNIEIDEVEEYVSSMTSAVEHTLISIECDYLTVEQFADIQGVTPITVRQWIRRGKLRSAKKNGRDWLIPSFEDKPSRGYTQVQYILEDQIQIDEFPFVAICDSIFIHQDDDKTKYICIFINFQTGFRERMVLNRQEVESLELAILSSGKARPEGSIRFVPYIDREI